MEFTKDFLDREGLELFKRLITESLKLTGDGKTVVIDENNVISAKVNYVPSVEEATSTLVFDSSPAYVVSESETLVYTSHA